MAINPIGPAAQPTRLETEQPAKERPDATGRAEPAMPVDRVEVEQGQQPESSLMDYGPEQGEQGLLDEERLEEIRDRMQAGAYNSEVVHDAVMEGILAEFPELLNANE